MKTATFTEKKVIERINQGKGRKGGEGKGKIRQEVIKPPLIFPLSLTLEMFNFEVAVSS